MENDRIDTIDDTESSVYLDSEEAGRQLDLGGLFSKQFSNVSLLYRSPNGPTEIHSATRYGKRFILKGLKDEFREDPIYAMALAKEFEIGISLDHPNIRRTLSLENVEGVGQVIVLEYIDGCSLRSLIDNGGLTVASARAVAEQIAGALSYIHSKQIFHRDLKPSNVLVSHSGRTVKIIDFNFSDSDDFIVLKNPAGSRLYMAPEQQRQGASPSASADIYSFGVIMKKLSAVSGDNAMREIAGTCANPNPAKRPQTVAQIKLPSSHPSVIESVSGLLSSKALTYILISVCAGLSALITYMLITNP